MRTKRKFLWLTLPVAVAILLWPVAFVSRSASLRWDANPSIEGVTNYLVFTGPASRRYTGSNSAGTITNYPLPDFPAFYAVKAQHDGGESAFSDEILFVPGPAQVGARLHILSKKSAEGAWRLFSSIPLPATNRAEFFQLRISND